MEMSEANELIENWSAGLAGSITVECGLTNEGRELFGRIAESAQRTLQHATRAIRIESLSPRGERYWCA